MAQKKNWVFARAEYVVAAGLMWALRVLPLALANRLARSATRVLDIAIPKLRRVGLTNLSFAFPDLQTRERRRIINGVFQSIARMLVALARFPSLNRTNMQEWMVYDGLDHYLAAKAKGSGVLFATAHFGNWELSAFAHALMTEPMNVMVRPLDNPFIDRMVESRRTISGNRLIYKWDAARAVIKALRNNEAVGILIDQNTSPAEGVFVNFFNKPACAGSAFVKLAYHSGAAVLPGFAVWDKLTRKYILRFCPEVELTGSIEEDTQRIHRIFEDVIRQWPEQWMWIHRRWKTRPPGESPLY